jgi:hypothetical protein
MDQMISTRYLASLVVIVLLLIAPAAQAQSGGGYDLSWWTVDGGGGTAHADSSGYTLSGTAGQPDAGAGEGDSYVLVSGFWSGSTAASGDYRIYLPLVVRNA